MADDIIVDVCTDRRDTVVDANTERPGHPRVCAGGQTGAYSTFEIVETVTGAPGSAAKAENLGTKTAVKLKLTIPQGMTGVGKTGPKGDPGYTPQKNVDYFDGVTPVKGIDYFTPEEKAEMVEEVIESTNVKTYADAAAASAAAAAASEAASAKDASSASESAKDASDSKAAAANSEAAAKNSATEAEASAKAASDAKIGVQTAEGNAAASAQAAKASESASKAAQAAAEKARDEAQQAAGGDFATPAYVDGKAAEAESNAKAYTDEAIDAGKVNPETTGVFYHKGNGAGNTDVVLKVQSNNGVLQGYGDSSSAFHLSGVPVAFDQTAVINGGLLFQAANQSLDFNGAKLNNVSAMTHRGSKGVVEMGCDFNDGTLSDEYGHNFVVKNTNIGAGLGAADKAWSYQSLAPAADGTWERVFGVKADGTVFSKGVELATKDDVGGGDFLPLTGGTLSGNVIPSGAINLGDDANRWESIFAKLYYFSDGSNRSQYKFGMYQWGDLFTFTSRTAANGWLRDCWQINATTGVTNFSERPTYANKPLALKEEMATVDTEVVEGSTNPISGGAVYQHVADKDNPHDVTAEQVGAIPKEAYTDTWFGVGIVDGSHAVVSRDGIIVAGQDAKGVLITNDYMETAEGYVDGKPVLGFYGTENDELSILRNIESPVQDNDAANKKYVDEAVANAGGGGNISFAEEVPSAADMEDGELRIVKEADGEVYEILEYIESTGTQYFDTGFMPNQDTKVVMDMQGVSISASEPASSFWGARTSSSSKCFGVYWHKNNATFYSFYNNGYSEGGTSFPTERITVTQDKNVTTVGNVTIERTYAAFQCAYNLYLFAFNDAGTVKWYGLNRGYGGQIYDNGVLIRDYQPRRRLSDGLVGFYDKVNHTFGGSASGTAFVAGPVVGTQYDAEAYFKKDDVLYMLTDPVARAMAAGGAKVEVGTYVGTGTSGSSGATTLSFEGTPYLVIVYMNLGTASASNSYQSNDYAPMIAIRGALAIAPTINTSSNYINYWHTIYTQWGDNSVTWAGSTAGFQHNTSGKNYRYIALCV